MRYRSVTFCAMPMRRRSGFAVVLLCIAFASLQISYAQSSAAASLVPVHLLLQDDNSPLLSADFNQKTPGAAIGTGGASVGEPSGLGGLVTQITETAPGENYLLVSNGTGGGPARRLSWNLRDNAELTSGTVTWSFDITPTGLDLFNFGIRESTGSASTFVSVSYGTNGTIAVSDASGSVSLASNTYSANVTMSVVLRFDMDAGTSSLDINGTTVFMNRQHGISNAIGVGKLIIGYSSSNNGTAFQLDNLLVTSQ